MAVPPSSPLTLLPALPPGLLLLDVSYNQLSGALATLPPHLTYLDVRHNNLTGSVPALTSADLAWAYFDNNQ